MTTTSTLIDHTGRVLMVWQGPTPKEPESVRRFIDKILKPKNGKRKGKIV